MNGDQKRPLLSNEHAATPHVKSNILDEPTSNYDTPAIQFNHQNEPAVNFSRDRQDSGDGTDDETISGTRFQHLQNLKNLYQAGVLSDAEYNLRRAQLIDQLTGTTLTGTRSKSNTYSMAPSTSNSYLAPSVVSFKPPPAFGNSVLESATKYTFDIQDRKWRTSKVQIKLDVEPFARGKLRMAFHMQVLSDKKIPYVAKISMDPRDMKDRDIYFVDVEMQSLAKHYAQKFNEFNPPKKVDFVMAWLLELTDREGSPLCGVERFIKGTYRKHNNNYGYVSDNERNTPQAFSHFSYKCSAGELLICDIQGVSDMYTDPQVHSRDGTGFGKGNLGQKGIDKFLATHRCNLVCKFLKLQPLNGQGYSSVGTKPMKGKTVMAADEAAIVSMQAFPKLKGSNKRVIEEDTRNAGCCCVVI